MPLFIIVLLYTVECVQASKFHIYWQCEINSMITNALFLHILLNKDLIHLLSRSLRTTVASSCLELLVSWLLEILTSRIMEAVPPMPPVAPTHQQGGCCANKAWHLVLTWATPETLPLKGYSELFMQVRKMHVHVEYRKPELRSVIQCKETPNFKSPYTLSLPTIVFVWNL